MDFGLGDISTRVELSPTPGTNSFLGGGHLHSRGAQFFLGRPSRGGLGTSPLAWSSGSLNEETNEYEGDISTRVELSFALLIFPSEGGDISTRVELRSEPSQRLVLVRGHLHSRGAQSVDIAGSVGVTGTSPLAWSSARQPSADTAMDGDISTCVELRSIKLSETEGIKGHLHLRGAQMSVLFLSIAVLGTSPLAWSSVSNSANLGAVSRDISTCVELSGSTRGGHGDGRGHLHLRGAQR